jgi:sugar-specific transcriptional regulator TrmB
VCALVSQEYIEKLAELGLTQTEAKVYIALLTLKRATANGIHKESNIARQEVYRLLSDLEEKGLIEKIISKPKEFRPIPVKNAIAILLQRRRQQIRQLGKTAIQQFRNFEIDCARTLPPDWNPQVMLLSKSEISLNGHINKIRKAVCRAEKSVMCSTIFSVFIRVKTVDENVWKQAVRRGVKFRFIIGANPVEKVEYTLDPMLKDNDYFEIRMTPTILPAQVVLIDEKEAFYIMGLELDCPVLWSSTPSFVELIKDYLKNKWKLIEYTQNQKTRARRTSSNSSESTTTM